MKTVFRAFRQSVRGSTTMLFSLSAVLLFAMVGLAIDYNRWLDAKQHMLSSMDAAVLAAGRVLQTGGTEAEAIAVAQSYYREATKTRIKTFNDHVGFKVIDNGLAVTSTGSAEIETPFMALLGLKSLPLMRVVGGNSDHEGDERSVARIAAGENAGMSVETSLMLDVSGSMQGQKLVDLKEAAKDLVNIIVWEQQSKHWSKLAIVPFSADVRPPADMMSSVANAGGRFTRSAFGRTYYYAPTPCVGERGGSNAYTDAPPLGSNTVTRVHRQVANATTLVANCATHASGEVVPLTRDRQMLFDRIDNLVAQGGTAGHVGTAWAYYMLSPQWSSVLKADSSPSSFGRKDVRKVAVLMSDGEYNFTYDADGGPSSSVGGTGSNGSGSINRLSSAAQAVQVCARMKSSGIEVYTVGFDLGGNQTAINTLRECASSANNAYNTTNGEELKNAFRDIALKVSSLYLSN